MAALPAREPLADPSQHERTIQQLTMSRLSLQLGTPLAVLAGHSKAVSYVRWLDGDTLITGSTDNCLKLWPLGQGSGTLSATRTFSGKTPDCGQHGAGAPCGQSSPLARCLVPHVHSSGMTCNVA